MLLIIEITTISLGKFNVDTTTNNPTYIAQMLMLRWLLLSYEHTGGEAIEYASR